MDFFGGLAIIAIALALIAIAVAVGIALAPFIGVIFYWTAVIALVLVLVLVVGLLGWGILRGIVWLLYTIFGERVGTKIWVVLFYPVIFFILWRLGIL